MDGKDDDSERTTALIRRDDLVGLIDRTMAPEPVYVRTVRRDKDKDIQVVNVGELQPLRTRRASDYGEADLGRVSPLLVLGIITLLIVTFIAATQLR